MLLKKIDIQLFADAEITSGAAPTDGAGGQVAAADNNALATQEGAISAESSGAQENRLPWEQVREIYKNEIEADAKAYAKQYSKDVVSRRVAKNKAALDEFEALKPYLDRELYRHGLKSGDYKSLCQKIEDDKSLFRERAMANGTTEEIEETIYNERQKSDRLEAEIAKRDAEAREEAELSQVREHYKKIAADVQAIKDGFDSGFDLKREMETNAQFARYANEPHMTILEAYKLSHYDEIVGGAAARAASDAVTKTTNAIRSSSANVPKESAMNAGAPAQMKVDPSKLSSREISEYIARAQRGENITFR